MKENLPIIWIDCEMTGLSLDSDALIEIAVVVTDSELTQLGEGIELVIKPPAQALAQMSDFVRNMHEESGLLLDLPKGIDLSAAESIVLEHLKSLGVEENKSPIAGNSIWMDRNFIARDLPLVDAYLHYRSIDVSSIKELAKRWYPKIYFNSPEKIGNHRALADIHDSIIELAYYRDNLFPAS
jgi:oligoribonuclease